MCGIAGIVKSSGQNSLSCIRTVAERLRHRGPDDSGFLSYSRQSLKVGRDLSLDTSDPEVLLIHRRLSIIDLGKGGWQPMGTSDRRYFTVFNGEIYNYVELRSELASLGHQFKSHSDTEVLLEAFAEWGVGALSRFVGMFAFALLDTCKRKILLARDFFGIKPLYYTVNGSFAFASEIKALLAFSSISPSADAETTFRYLRFGLCDDGSKTIFRDIAQVPPAHYVEIDLDSPDKIGAKPYWTCPTERRTDLTLDEAAHTLRNLFLESIRLHLRSDVPIGAALSGGVDSSSIVMAIRKLEPQLELSTFSFISDQDSINEEHWIDVIGKSSRANVHKVSATPQELVRDLDQLMCVQDQPILSSSPYAQYRVFQSAREAGIKVMINGQGADELLAGYRYYLPARIASLVRHHEWRAALSLLMRTSRLPDMSATSLIARVSEYFLPQALRSATRKAIGEGLVPQWINRQWFDKNDVVLRLLSKPSDEDVLRHTLWEDVKSTSLPQLLRYEDRNSMAFSIESRVPFLTPQIASFVLSLPENFIIAEDGTSKAVFRRAMRGIVPDQVLARRDKIGFATPEASWLSAIRPWVETTLNSPAAQNVPVLNFHHLQRQCRSVTNGTSQLTSPLWRALSFIKWSEQFAVGFN